MLRPQDSALFSDADMGELLTEYVKNLATYAKDIRRLIDARDAEGLSRLLHQLKGSGRSYGYSRITELAALAEAPLRTGGAGGLAGAIPVVEELLTYIGSGDESPGLPPGASL